MAENEKLLATLRLNLEKLKSDTSSANSILKDLEKVKLGNIDINGVKEAVSLLKLIEDETKKISSSTGIKIDLSSIDNMKKALESVTISTKGYKEELAKIQNTHNQSIIDNKLDTDTLKNLNTQLTNLKDKYQLTETQLKPLITTQKQYTNEIIKQEQAQEKLNTSALKAYAQQKANSSQYSTMDKQLENITGNSSMAMSSSNPNTSIMDRFKISAAYAASGAALYALKNTLTDVINTNSTYEASLVDLGRILGNVTDKELADFGKAAIQSAKEFGQSLQSVQDTMSSLAAAGVQSKDDLNSMTKTVLTGLNTSNITDAATMTNYLTSSMRQLNISFTDSEKVLDSWNYLADKHVATTADFAEATSKAGAASKAMGIDLDHLNAMTALLSDRVGVSGTEIGDAIKAMEAKLETPKALKTLQQYGIEVKADADHFRNFGDIMTDVSKKMDSFGENSVAGNDIMTALGGTLRKNWITILSQDYQQVDEIAKQSSESVGYSATKNTATMQTYAKQVEVFNANVKELYISIGQAGLLDQLKMTVSAMSGFVNVLDKIPTPIKTVLGLMAELAVVTKGVSASMGVLTGINLKQFIDSKNLDLSFLGGVKGTAGASTTLKIYENAVAMLQKKVVDGNISQAESAAILEVVGGKLKLATSSTNTLASAEGAVTVITEKNTLELAKYQAELDAGKISEEEYIVIKKELNATTAQAVADYNALKISQGAAVVGNEEMVASEEALNLVQKETAASSKALNMSIGGVLAIISIVVVAYSTLTSSIKSSKDKMDELSSSIQQQQSDISNLQDKLSTLDELHKKTTLTNDDKTQLSNINSELADKYPELISYYDKESGAFQVNIDKLKELIAKKQELAMMDNANNLGLAKNASAEAQKKIDEANIELASGRKVVNPGTKNQYVANITSDNKRALIASINEEMAVRDKANQIINQSTKYINDYINTETKNGESTDVVNKKLLGLGYSQTQINDAIKNSTQITTDNTLAKQDNANSTDNQINSIDDQVTALNDLQTAYTNTSDKISKYNTYLSELNKTHTLSASSVNEIIGKYPELIGYLGNESGMRQRLTELISQQGDAGKQTYKQILDASYNAMSQEEKDEVDKANAKLMTDNAYYNKTVLGSKDLIDKYRNIYGVDLQNYKNLASAKAATEDLLLSRLSSAWAKYSQAVASVMSSHASLAAQMDNGSDEAMMRLSKILNNSAGVMQARTQINTLNALRDSINTDFSAIGMNFNSVNLGNIGASNGSSGSSAANSAIAQAQQTANQNLLNLQTKLVDALKKKYDEDRQNALNALKDKEDAEIAYYTGKLKDIQDEIDALQNTKSDDEAKLTALKKELTAWTLDDSQYSKGKQQELQKQIDDLSKQMQIKDLEDQQKNLQDQQQAMQDSYQKQQDTVNSQYDDLLKDANIYAEANKKIMQNNQTEILNLIVQYTPDYASVGQVLGQALSTSMLSEIQNGLSALKQIQSGNYNAQTSSSSSGSSSSSSSASSARTLQVGSRGDDVKRLQQYLGISADGIFGNQTKQAVINFQKNHSLSADGIVGKNTHNILGFRTGGYTGDDEGLAMLHNKELILNQADTKNILDVVTMTRDLVKNFSPKFDMPTFPIPKFNMPQMPSINTQPQYVLPEGFIKQYNTINNDSDFSMKNGMDNYNRNIKNLLKTAGYNMGVK